VTAEISAELLVAMRAGHPREADRLMERMAGLDPGRLAASLPNDAARIAMWVNLYNAATQRLVETHPERFARRMRFFRQPAIVVAGRTLSLDAIEHGLLRRSRWKAGLGWLGNPFPHPFERRFRVAAVEARIHFALNCAAASCPPIAAYRASRLDGQLDLATRSYLAASVRRERERLVVPRIFLWFMGDFGGPSGVRRFLAGYGYEASGARLRFAAYDWSLRAAAWSDPVEWTGPRADDDGDGSLEPHREGTGAGRE
jgi:hypothetical protein